MSLSAHRLKSCLAITVMLLRWGWDGMCQAVEILECPESRIDFCRYHVQAQADGVRCLAECGFAIVRDAVPIHVVDKLLGQWKALEHNEKRHRLFADHNPGGQRGRKETMPPFTRGFNDSRMFAADKVTGIVNGYARQLGIKASLWPQLHTYLLLDAPPGCPNQEWHLDDHEEIAGIKVQIPLVDVTANMGPIQLIPGSQNVVNELSAESESATNRRAKKQKIVHGNVTRGTAILYSHQTTHRGLANPSKIRRRTIDISYTSEEYSIKENYMDTYYPRAQKAMRNYVEEYRKYLPKEVLMGRFEL